MKSDNIIYLKKDKLYIQQMRARTPHKKGSLQLQRQRRPDIINNSYVFSTSINNSISNNNSSTLNNHSSIMHSNTQQSSAYQHQVQIQIPLNYTQSIHTKNSQLALNTKNNHINYMNPNKSANYSHPNNSSIQTNTNKMSLVKKYMQQEMLQARTNKYSLPKEKQYRQVVISDQFIRSHKLYKMLKEQISVADARFVREANSLNQTLDQQNKRVKDIKDGNHKLKVQLWELKNQLMELKGLIEDEQEENKKLVEQYEFANNEREAEYQQGQGQQGDQQEGDGQGQDDGQKEKEKEDEKINRAEDEDEKINRAEDEDEKINRAEDEDEKINRAEDEDEEKQKVDVDKLQCSRNIDILKYNLEQIKNEDRQQEIKSCIRSESEIGELERLQLNQSIQYKQSQKQKQI